MQLSCNGIPLEVEDHGPPSGEPVLLVMGLGMQLLAWPLPFVESLVARGFRVIRFDNRDIGLSRGFDELGTPNLAVVALRATLGMRVKSPYSLSDMAADSVGVLDALGIAKAHVCGASMGGMIAQRMAAQHPERVKSVTLMMTTSGARKLPGPTLTVQRAMLSRPDPKLGFGGIVDHYVKLYGLIGSPGFRPDSSELRARLETSIRRSFRPQGTARQLVAIAADGDRSDLLARIRQPTQIIHGRDDALVPVEAGRALAQRIAGAEIDVIDGMGHDLPKELWPRFVGGIADAAGRA
jgi:pimeloyl-ACP methyl ester carboxylesterase